MSFSEISEVEHAIIPAERVEAFLKLFLLREDVMDEAEKQKFHKVWLSYIDYFSSHEWMIEIESRDQQVLQALCFLIKSPPEALKPELWNFVKQMGSGLDKGTTLYCLMKKVSESYGTTPLRLAVSHRQLAVVMGFFSAFKDDPVLSVNELINDVFDGKTLLDELPEASEELPEASEELPEASEELPEASEELRQFLIQRGAKTKKELDSLNQNLRICVKNGNIKRVLNFLKTGEYYGLNHLDEDRKTMLDWVEEMFGGDISQEEVEEVEEVKELLKKAGAQRGGEVQEKAVSDLWRNIQLKSAGLRNVQAARSVGIDLSGGEVPLLAFLMRRDGFTLEDKDNKALFNELWPDFERRSDAALWVLRDPHWLIYQEEHLKLLFAGSNAGRCINYFDRDGKTPLDCLCDNNKSFERWMREKGARTSSEILLDLVDRIRHKSFDDDAAIGQTLDQHGAQVFNYLLPWIVSQDYKEEDFNEICGSILSLYQNKGVLQKPDGPMEVLKGILSFKKKLPMESILNQFLSLPIFDGLPVDSHLALSLAARTGFVSVYQKIASWICLKNNLLSIVDVLNLPEEYSWLTILDDCQKRAACGSDTAVLHEEMWWYLRSTGALTGMEVYILSWIKKNGRPESAWNRFKPQPSVEKKDLIDLEEDARALQSICLVCKGKGPLMDIVFSLSHEEFLERILACRGQTSFPKSLDEELKDPGLLGRVVACGLDCILGSNKPRALIEGIFFRMMSRLIEHVPEKQQQEALLNFIRDERLQEKFSGRRINWQQLFDVYLSKIDRANRRRVCLAIGNKGSSSKGCLDQTTIAILMQKVSAGFDPAQAATASRRWGRAAVGSALLGVAVTLLFIFRVEGLGPLQILFDPVFKLGEAAFPGWSLLVVGLGLLMVSASAYSYVQRRQAVVESWAQQDLARKTEKNCQPSLPVLVPGFHAVFRGEREKALISPPEAAPRVSVRSHLPFC